MPDDCSVVVGSIGVTLPEGVILIEASEFMTSWERPNDVLTQRLILAVNGHNVQIVRHDFDPDNAGVMIDGGSINIVPLDKVDNCISQVAKS